MTDDKVASLESVKEKDEDGDGKSELKEVEERTIAFLQNFSGQQRAEDTAPLCEELLSYYHKGGAYRELSFRLIPSLVECYLFARVDGLAETVVTVGTLLLTIYNCELQRHGEPQKNEVVRLPPPTFPTIYNRDPSSTFVQEGLTERHLSRLNLDAESHCEIGPFLPASSLIAGNRFIILSYLIKVYNSHLQSHSALSVKSFCRMCHRVCRSGFAFPSIESVKLKVDHGKRRSSLSNQSLMEDFATGRRLSVSPYFLCESLNGVQYAMYNGDFNSALAALESIHQRAKYELYGDVLLITNAMFDTVDAYRRAKVPQEGVIVGVPTILPASKTSPLSCQSVMTRASVKIRKFSKELLSKTKAAITGDSNTANQSNENGLQMQSNDDSGSEANDSSKVHSITSVTE